MADYGHGDTSWFVRDRFGMFIHWGLYAMPARLEWVKSTEKITEEKYQMYFDLFEPDLFCPKEWAKAAKEAGMKYFVFTTKHHDGFCLWDTKYTDYSIMHTGPKRDLLREVVDAFRAEGLKVGFYYSLLDWHHPDFTMDCFHPRRDDSDWEEFDRPRDMARYRQYMLDQIRELLTNYGKIDIIWYDFSYKRPDARNGKGRDDWGSEDIIRLTRELQPDIIVDNRLDLPGSADIVTPENFTPDKAPVDENGNPLVWEGCQTFSGSWGYHRDEPSWKSVPMCIQLLVNHVSRGGNLLLNVGPTARGVIDERAKDRLAGLGKWMKANSRSIYGCGAAPEEFPVPPDCRYTWNPETKRLYLHCFAWPFKHILLSGLAGKVKYAQLLFDGSEILFEENNPEVPTNLSAIIPDGAVKLQLPVNLPQGCEVPVIEIFMK